MRAAHVLLVLLLPVGTLTASGGDRMTTSGPSRERPHATSAPAARPGPRYLLLRYNEDFSYLDGPEGSYDADFFDPIKNIHIAEDWRLRLGGEVRLRMESETNKNFGARDPSQDTILLHRYLLHADLAYRRLFRLFVEGADIRVEQRDLPQVPGMENTFDLNQAFFELRFAGEQTPLGIRFGRQELIYGRERLIGKLDWMNVSRRFDGAKLFYSSPALDVDVFWTKPVVFMTTPFSNPFNTHINEGMNRKPDQFREEQDFYGMYASYKGLRGQMLDAYVVGLNDSGDFANANNRIGDLNIHTVGGRWGGRLGGFDYDVEGAGQWGTWSGDDVHAWMAALDAGYTFQQAPMTPRIGLGFDYASGDDTPRDGAHETFHQLFPTGHAYLGYIDLVARQNVLAPNVNVSFRPLKGVTTKVFYYHFWLDSSFDGLYNAGGVLIRRNAFGSSGTDAGDEVDVTVNWEIDPHSSLLVGWSHFWPNNFIESSGRSRDADFVYVQYQYRF